MNNISIDELMMIIGYREAEKYALARDLKLAEARAEKAEGFAMQARAANLVIDQEVARLRATLANQGQVNEDTPLENRRFDSLTPVGMV